MAKVLFFRLDRTKLPSKQFVLNTSLTVSTVLSLLVWPISVLFATIASMTCAWAATPFPVKPIRIVVPAAPGGGLDVTTRIVAKKMSEMLKQSVVVENRAGADTLLGTRLVKNAPADGYTILAQANGFTALPALRLDPGYDPVKDFRGIGLMVRSPQVMLVASEQPYRTLEEFVSRAKANPGALSYASAGVGGPPHLGAALFFHHTGLNVVHVPYKGNGAALPDVAASRVDTIFGAYAGAASYLQGGRMRALGITGTKRLAALPEVPTFREQGFNYSYYFWLGLLVPAGTPKDAIARLADALHFATRSKDIEERLRDEGSESMSMSPEEFQEYLVDETRQMSRVIRELNIVRE
jgi:tripartite-type tricarboxylate transporter receptor subunit TctC